VFMQLEAIRTRRSRGTAQADQLLAWQEVLTSMQSRGAPPSDARC
jgi:hypothetical protein